ncbi:Protein FATTY ACID EXPORT 6 [Hondaea fermentalgiana]|uniref:Protein FATTY ACID EXPORT 6 n=1 Tax=Hondaea fermentalgiana TaxID=2315210 RepID=A0A2R5GUR4_9STRA|nr:Protein FATTY ACID EXPORT 6 [Hondaea fermentalgiana]|eukprot:GBG31654.1 Protein FATTY ACID EXPORT 6 [Hondaea fermentalgiana]
MLDFCLTIPYGALLVLGGLLGAIRAGSIVSALTGCGIGLALIAIGWTSYQEYLENKNEEDKRYRSPTYAYVVVSAVLTLIVTMLMFERYQETGVFMPAGFVAALSAGMLAFYAYKLLFSGDVGSHAKRAYEHND